MVVVSAVVFWWLFGETLGMERIVAAETWLRDQAGRRPVVSGMVALLTYVVVTGLSLPVALLLTLVISWLFGFWPALVVISLGSTAGATLAMLASRYLLRGLVRGRMSEKFRTVAENLQANGRWYLATLRLVPPVPFFAINLLAGLTTIGVWEFWWISQLCMLPATAVYCWAGASLPDLQTLQDEGAGSLVSVQTLAGLGLLALLPLSIRWISSRIKSSVAR